MVKASENKELLNLRISDLSRGGSGVAREESGRVIFVPFTAPGDLASCRIVDEQKHYAQGELVKLLEPSPTRQTPPCPVFGLCGACEWQHIPYYLQWKTKREGVKHALDRLSVKIPEPIDELPAEKIWGYRNRIQLRGMADEIGFFAASSHRLIPIRECPIARAEINSSIETARAEGAEKTKRPYKVEIEVNPTGRVLFHWNMPHAASGFRQVHDEQNEKLRQWVARVLTPGKRLLDLFGGSGNLSVTLADKMTEIHCVDTDAPARYPDGIPGNIPGNIHDKIKFHRSSVLPWLLRNGPNFANRSCSAIIDPPRIGIGKVFDEFAATAEKAGVNEIVMVGCEADTWAKDVSRWIRRGWKFEKAAVLDLFPQTHHVESIGLLRL